MKIVYLLIRPIKKPTPSQIHEMQKVFNHCRHSFWIEYDDWEKLIQDSFLNLCVPQKIYGQLGESWARLVLPCVTMEDEGVYECRGTAGSREVVVTTKVRDKLQIAEIRETVGMIEMMKSITQIRESK